MNETSAMEGRRKALRERLKQALTESSLQIVAVPENGATNAFATLACAAGHEFPRSAASILKWRSNRCTICHKEAAIEKINSKLPDPNELPWLPADIKLGRGTKPRDLRNNRFGKLTAISVVGKHTSGSLLWQCLCDCGSSTTKKSSSLTSGKAKSCGCTPGTVKTYKTIPPNKGTRYTTKAMNEVFSSRKAWGDAVKFARGDSCEICGWQEAACDVHHLHERHKGGKNTLDNAIVLCPNHHRIAHEKGIDYVLKLNSRNHTND